MRRAERAIQDEHKLTDMLEQAQVCRIGFNDDPYPYVVPVNFVYRAGCLYFHSAAEGRKMALISADGRVCFELDHGTIVDGGDRACAWGTHYESIIGEGRASVVSDPAEKRSALEALMEKYSGRKGWTVAASEVDGVAVVRIEVEHLSGKASE